MRLFLSWTSGSPRALRVSYLTSQHTPASSQLFSSPVVGSIAVGAATTPRQNVRICVLQTPDTHHRVIQSQQMQEYALFLSSSLPWLCLFPSLILFFPIGVHALPGDISGRDDEPDRLTRVLFDYYFGI